MDGKYTVLDSGGNFTQAGQCCPKMISKWRGNFAQAPIYTSL